MKRILVFSLLLVFAAIWANLSATGLSAGAMKSLPGCETNELSANDDESTDEIALQFTINFLGTNYSSLFVNN